MCHELVGKERIIGDNIYLVSAGWVNDIVNSDVPVKQPAMCVDIMILMIEEKATAALRVKIPEQNAETILSEEASQVYGCGGLTNATFDVIYGNLFQASKLISNYCL
jgi:hypothetical protein